MVSGMHRISSSLYLIYLNISDIKKVVKGFLEREFLREAAWV